MTREAATRHVYGPVPSRRLGRSLGIDLVPYKTCSYDCIYCQLGRTTCRTVQRKEWAPIGRVIEEVARSLPAGPDYITLSGSGEPTLCTRLDELIGGIKSATATPIAVLTNGSLLWQDQVRKELLNADLVVPSLDAGEPVKFRYINRPHEDISFEKMLDGLMAFRSDFKGQYWLEVFLLAGYTAIEADVEKIARCVDRIQPDRVQLNTATRPTAEPFAEPVSPSRLAELASMFRPPAEVIAEFTGGQREKLASALPEQVLNMLRRRPCSIQDLANGLSVHPNEVVKHLVRLTADGLVQQERSGSKLYHKAKHTAAV